MFDIPSVAGGLGPPLLFMFSLYWICDVGIPSKNMVKYNFLHEQDLCQNTIKQDKTRKSPLELSINYENCDNKKVA